MKYKVGDLLYDDEPGYKEWGLVCNIRGRQYHIQWFGNENRASIKFWEAAYGIDEPNEDGFDRFISAEDYNKS